MKMSTSESEAEKGGVPTPGWAWVAPLIGGVKVWCDGAIGAASAVLWMLVKMVKRELSVKRPVYISAPTCGDDTTMARPPDGAPALL